MPDIPNFDNVGGDIGAAGAIIGGIGSLVGGQMNASTYNTEAQYYQQAAGLAGQNARIEQQSIPIQEYLADLKLTQTNASVLADTMGNGLFGPSTTEIIQSNAQQAGLTQALIGEQGALNVSAYQQQATTLQGEAAAAKSAAKASQTGGFLGLLGGVAKAASLLF